MSLRRFSDADALTLRALIARYGIDGVALELWIVLKQYGAQTVRYRLSAKAAKRLAYATARAMGHAPHV